MVFYVRFDLLICWLTFDRMNANSLKLRSGNIVNDQSVKDFTNDPLWDLVGELRCSKYARIAHCSTFDNDIRSLFNSGLVCFTD